MTKNEATTATDLRCATDYCEKEAEIGIIVLGNGKRPDTAYQMCTDDATRVYNLFDFNRKGGKIELFDL